MGAGQTRLSAGNEEIGSQKARGQHCLPTVGASLPEPHEGPSQQDSGRTPSCE